VFFVFDKHIGRGFFKIIAERVEFLLEVRDEHMLDYLAEFSPQIAHYLLVLPYKPVRILEFSFRIPEHYPDFFKSESRVFGRESGALLYFHAYNLVKSHRIAAGRCDGRADDRTVNFPRRRYKNIPASVT
jgi:hypothetical protein